MTSPSIRRSFRPARSSTHFFAAQRPPLISLQPQDIDGVTNITMADNAPVTFYSEAYGPGTLQYQWWYSDGINPTTLDLSAKPRRTTRSPPRPAWITRYYQLVVTSQFGSVTSAPAHLFVPERTARPFIVDLPTSQNVYLGHIIQLHVVPGGTAPFTYQWQKNGANIVNDYRTSGAQTDTLTIGYAQSTDTATYTVIVTGQGSATSTPDARYGDHQHRLLLQCGHGQRGLDVSMVEPRLTATPFISLWARAARPALRS